MPQESGKESVGEKLEQKTLAEVLFRFSNPRTRLELEKFRIKFEAEHGETDITKRYTSTLPLEDQNWLVQHHPKRYWDGLPPFVQAFLRNKMVATHRVGKLDDMPDDILQLYLRGQMRVGDSKGDGFQR
jgi:hypothetical protein